MGEEITRGVNQKYANKLSGKYQREYHDDNNKENIIFVYKQFSRTTTEGRINNKYSNKKVKPKKNAKCTSETSEVQGDAYRFLRYPGNR